MTKNHLLRSRFDTKALNSSYHHMTVFDISSIDYAEYKILPSQICFLNALFVGVLSFTPVLQNKKVLLKSCYLFCPALFCCASVPKSCPVVSHYRDSGKLKQHNHKLFLFHVPCSNCDSANPDKILKWQPVCKKRQRQVSAQNDIKHQTN